MSLRSLTPSTDYRVPQQLHNLGVLVYSPPLDGCIRRLEQLEPGCTREQELRGCSIWAVELMRRQIVRDHPEAEADVNAVLLDFLLYDLAKEREEVEASSGKPRCDRPGRYPCELCALVSSESAVSAGLQPKVRLR